MLDPLSLHLQPNYYLLLQLLMLPTLTERAQFLVLPPKMASQVLCMVS